MAEQPLVSVIVCSYNAGEFLPAALSSVLKQTYKHLEVLVVDDGSTDGSVESARRTFTDSRLRWFHQKNSGKPVALNLALREMRGDFYAIQDADDLSAPQRIEKLVMAMHNHPDVAAVYSGHNLILNGRQAAPTSRAKSATECQNDIARLRMPAHDPTAMYRTAMVGNLRYEEDLLVGEGYDYMLRVGERWPMIVLGECLYSYRVHVASITRSDPNRRERLVLEVIRRACQRRGIAFEERPRSTARLRGGTRASADNNIAAQFIDSVLDQRRARQRLGALMTGIQCSRLHPLCLHYHKALVYSISPWWLVQRLRRTTA